MTILLIRVGKPLWMTSNHRLHHMEKADRAKRLRILARARAAQLRLKVQSPVSVKVTIRTPTNAVFDPPNAWPTVKPIIDGLVDAGVLEDDSSTQVPEITFVRGAKTGRAGVYIVELEFSPIVEGADKSLPGGGGRG